MTRALPELTPVARVAQRYALHRHGAVQGCNHAGAPVPVPGPDGLRIAVLFTALEKAPDTGIVHIQAPSYLLHARADAGTFVELRAITPRDLGIAQDPGAWLGDLGPPPDPEKRARLLDLYDAALPAFTAGPLALTATAKRAALEIRALFPEVTEPPLAPYYAALGKRFFAWLDRLAAS